MRDGAITENTRLKNIDDDLDSKLDLIPKVSWAFEAVTGEGSYQKRASGRGCTVTSECWVKLCRNVVPGGDVRWFLVLQVGSFPANNGLFARRPPTILAYGADFVNHTVARNNKTDGICPNGASYCPRCGGFTDTFSDHII